MIHTRFMVKEAVVVCAERAAFEKGGPLPTIVSNEIQGAGPGLNDAWNPKKIGSCKCKRAIGPRATSNASNIAKAVVNFSASEIWQITAPLCGLFGSAMKTGSPLR